jgi:phosphate starvation-inducible protein PhoH
MVGTLDTLVILDEAQIRPTNEMFLTRGGEKVPSLW